MDTVIRTLVEKALALMENLPGMAWATLFLLALGLIIAVLLGFVWRLWRGDAVETKWFKIGGSESTHKHQAELDRLRKELGDALEKTKKEHSYVSRISDDRQLVIEITKDFLGDFIGVLDGSLAVNVTEFVTRLFDLVLHMLRSVVHGPVGESNPLRIGLFLPDEADPESLRLLGSCNSGFSGLQIQSKRLAVRGTAAGFSYLSGEIYRNEHLSERKDGIFRVRGDGRFPYESIVCVPVRVGSVIRGVLCIDARLPNSFSEEDIIHLKYASTLIALGLTLMDLEHERAEPAVKALSGEG